MRESSRAGPAKANPVHSAKRARACLISWFKRIFRLSQTETALRPGEWGERAAADYLRYRLGYELVARNWRSGREEIDLVCRQGAILVFVEVKTRSERALVPGVYAVDHRKKKALRRAIHSYLNGLRRPPRTFRFDVVEVTSGPAGGAARILHFENVPLFSKYYRRG